MLVVPRLVEDLFVQWHVELDADLDLQVVPEKQRYPQA